MIALIQNFFSEAGKVKCSELPRNMGRNRG
jgi:hypothetical protein